MKVSGTSHSSYVLMDLREAKSRWVKSIQSHSFAEKYQRLLSGEAVIYKGQLILYLNDNFVICCRGRLNESDLQKIRSCFQLSTVLQSFWYSLSTVRYIVVALQLHCGIYWIVKGCGLVRKIIRRCVTMMENWFCLL